MPLQAMYVEIDGKYHQLVEGERTACGILVPQGETFVKLPLPDGAKVHCAAEVGPEASVQQAPVGKFKAAEFVDETAPVEPVEAPTKTAAKSTAKTEGGKVA